jgi:hypothetical protein
MSSVDLKSDYLITLIPETDCGEVAIVLPPIQLTAYLTTNDPRLAVC